MDTVQLGSQLTPALIVAMLVSMLKPFLELRFPATHMLHDALLRMLACTLGIASMLCDYACHTAHFTPIGLEYACRDGILVGVGAILTYHSVSGSFFADSLKNS